jgi:polar amino acid transport system substrate-binding protein
MNVNQTIIDTSAPTGVLRASINLGNPILANRDVATGRPFGISVDLANELARRLELPLELVVLESAGKSVEAVATGLADFGFFAVDPKRGEEIAFTEPYVLIQGAYLVKEESAIVQDEEVDRAGRTVTVGKGSAYDLYLTRELKNAAIARAPTSPPAVVDVFLEQGHDVAAGVRQQLEADCRRLGGLRVLPGRFMVIRRAMGISRARGSVAAQMLAQFVEDAKASGFVAQAIIRHGIEGATVAPLK